MGSRRQSREWALSALYARELNPEAPEEALRIFTRAGGDSAGTQDYARQLLEGVIRNLNHLDGLIGKCAKNWDLKRITRIDRNILRLALFELCFRPDVPPLACINEAVDLAKKFSTGNSGAFVNGILDEIRKNLDEKENQESGESLS